MSENIHEGHRNRLKTEVLSEGPNALLPPEKLLEMLLFYGIPRQDTAGMARELLRRFGDLKGVLEADIEDLITVKGITRNAASLIKLMVPMGRAYVVSKYQGNKELKNHNDIGQYILTRYFGVKQECFSLLCLNRLGRVISFELLADGNTDVAAVSIRTFLEKVLKTDATAVVIAHNHPSGVALPSKGDVKLTQKLKSTLDAVSVNLLDHIIIGDDTFTSMAISEQFGYLFK